MKNILVVDAGNSRVKYALFKNGKIVKRWWHLTSECKTETAAVLQEALARRTRFPVALSSVVPSATDCVRQWCGKNKRQLVEVTSKDQHLIKGTEGKLGADLTAQAAYALMHYGKGKPLLVLSFGTASTMTAVKSDGTFAGCIFALGLESGLTALSERCALLTPVTAEFKDPPSLGFDTEGAMKNGAILAHVGMVKEWVLKGREILGGDAVTVATGGFCQTIQALLTARAKPSVLDVIDRELTLKGIRLLAGEALVSSCPGRRR